MTSQIPTLKTERLFLRPFASSDAKRVQELAGDYELAKTTATVPHPYEDGVAESWISTHQIAWQKGTDITWAAVAQTSNELVGCMHIALNRKHESGELGYWVGRPYWGKGLGTEGALAMLSYGFDTLDLHRIHARHMKLNPASGRIMQKIGMTYEGTLRESEIRWGERQDICLYSILRHEWAA